MNFIITSVFIIKTIFRIKFINFIIIIKFYIILLNNYKFYFKDWYYINNPLIKNFLNIKIFNFYLN